MRGGYQNYVAQCTLHLSAICKRHFAYHNTLKSKLHGPKPLVMVIHPVTQAKTHQEHVWDAAEALGLAYAAKWNVLPGPSEPRGGWNSEELSNVEYLRELRERNRVKLPSEWHLDRFEDESDEEYDIDDAHWKSQVLRLQWAESCILRIRRPDRVHFFGKGQMELLKYVYLQQPCNFVFVNTFLSSKQHNYLESALNSSLSALQADISKAVNEAKISLVSNEGDTEEDAFRIPTSVEVIDRYRIILEIFSTRAKRKEAKLQIALSRIMLMRSRLHASTVSFQSQQKLLMNTGLFSKREWVSSQFIQSTETFAEYQRRLSDDILKKIRYEISELQKARKTHREGRQNVLVMAIIGYTNTGKTALMNRLCDSDLKVRDLLFQTLDTSFRRVRLSDGLFAIMMDSIGFIHDLPHSIYEAFQATLEEIKEANILVHVRDISHPQTEQQKQAVIKALYQIGVTEAYMKTNLIEVWNKVDLLTEAQMKTVLQELPQNAVPTCAVEGLGCDVLLKHLENLAFSLKKSSLRCLSFPVEEANEHLQFLSRHCVLIRDSLSVSEDGRMITVNVSANADELRKYYSKFPNIQEPQL